MENLFQNLWQSPLWGKFQEAVGRKTWTAEAPGASALVIRHFLPLGLCWLEIPRGPLFSDEKNLSEVLKKIVEIGKKERAVFIRMSPYNELPVMGYTLQAARHDHHPQTSLAIDLSLSEEDILKQMHPKGRYNIKVAEKHRVTVELSGDVGAFYSILQKTGNRDGFGIHPFSYYEKMMEALSPDAQLLLARHGGQVIAGGIFVYSGDWGIYYYGASDHSKRNLMAPYLVQWEAIKEAKRRGCKHYDFLGIAPEGAKNHPWAGVTEFKKKFGGEIAEYPPAKEITLRPFWHRLYRLAKH
ncbi:peptidoglycan bridge formation glycyltransferase FemA/FemB family protein [Candidatus Peregrinibacteria bacterium]|nr:peptidoglycan bridge formation glycyltransferase FemA/FemB family protein [Candidatus Peregrinibacteria bacterium]